MLELRPNCEWCDKDLPPASPQARICSYECTYCADCVETILRDVCPTCGGNFTPLLIRPRPIRPHSSNRRPYRAGPPPRQPDPNPLPMVPRRGPQNQRTPARRTPCPKITPLLRREIAKSCLKSPPSIPLILNARFRRNTAQPPPFFLAQILTTPPPQRTKTPDNAPPSQPPGAEIAKFESKFSASPSASC
ncbi:MAG: hypothetical protein CR993_00640 [Rhodobacterales bacterium]|nr:MAG: hypothetical protein CR993_00640 [Rhodobacterales bacterium]